MRLAGTLEVGSISMIPTMVRISVWVFDEVHHRVVGGKIIQRIDVGVVKMLMQVFMKISLHIVSETAKRCQPKVHDPEERSDLHILVHDRPRTFKHERKTTPGNRNVVWLPVNMIVEPQTALVTKVILYMCLEHSIVRGAIVAQMASFSPPAHEQS